ncbi:hypothetical protein M5X17_27680 [Paenibacillus alvei]|uniref:hypothetical protein n=1 Tax=Paenibacillus alvei TaxID=44250 RepID=UPI002282962C|nr:hypothetical protein [Paenibacillus alvei]MCY9737487.1 hypothetical protein [Paenibacillus alvei]
MTTTFFKQKFSNVLIKRVLPWNDVLKQEEYIIFIAAKRSLFPRMLRIKGKYLKYITLL